MAEGCDWLAQRARATPGRLALISPEGQWRYDALDRAVGEMALRLAGAGVRAGQHVAILLPNRVDTVCLIHALVRLGAVLVPLNLRLTRAELAWQVEQADCRTIICDASTEERAAGLGVARLLSVDPPVTAGGRALAKAPPAESIPPAPRDLNTIQGLIYTSGTTGQPKGALLTHGNHFWSATASALRLGTRPEDRWLVCMPLYHVGGLAIVLRCCLYGTTVVLQPGFEPEAVLRALAEERVSLLSLVPTMLQRLLAAEAAGLQAASLRCILLGGAAASPSLLAQSLRLDLPLALTYGLTEAASQVATARPGEVDQRPERIGQVLMFSELAIMDDEGETLPPGEIGQIIVRGPTVMAGYYGRPEATQQTIRDGWLQTGDMGYLDEVGYLGVVQRRADLIVSGGENIYPAEVEARLEQHPAVAEVCVVGLPDETWGQQVAAAVVLQKGAHVEAEALVAFCREELAGYKRPRLIRFSSALPRTASGKIRREAVRSWLKEGCK